jgi:hypothetical protein
VNRAIKITPTENGWRMLSPSGNFCEAGARTGCASHYGGFYPIRRVSVGNFPKGERSQRHSEGREDFVRCVSNNSPKGMRLSAQGCPPQRTTLGYTPPISSTLKGLPPPGQGMQPVGINLFCEHVIADC